MLIPRYQNISDRVKAAELSAIETFIYNWYPACENDRERWILGLKDALQEAEDAGRSDSQQPKVCSTGVSTYNIKTVKEALCKGMPHGSCKGEEMCDPSNACFEPACPHYPCRRR